MESWRVSKRHTDESPDKINYDRRPGVQGDNLAEIFQRQGAEK